MINFAYRIARRLRVRTHKTFRLSIRALALVVGSCVAFYVSILLQKNEFSAAWKLFPILVILAFIEFVLADVLADRSFPFDTERKLTAMEKRLGAQVIHTIEERVKGLIAEFRGCDQSMISGTVHIMAELSSTVDHRSRQGLLQLTNYVGPEGGKKGRITLINQGISGRCARTGVLETVGFADPEEYAAAMVRDFGFTQKEAQSHTKTARSYLAFPLQHESLTIGVLYFFSPEPQVFPRAARANNLRVAAQEIVNYLVLADLT